MRTPWHYGAWYRHRASEPRLGRSIGPNTARRMICSAGRAAVGGGVRRTLARGNGWRSGDGTNHEYNQTFFGRLKVNYDGLGHHLRQQEKLGWRLAVA